MSHFILIPFVILGLGLQVEERHISNKMNCWEVDYKLRSTAPALTVSPKNMSVAVDGWVSNSLVPIHSTPKYSELIVSSSDGQDKWNNTTFHILKQTDKNCRENLKVLFWKAGDFAPKYHDLCSPLIGITPQGSFYVRIILEHEHDGYEHDPLFGKRNIKLKIDNVSLEDVIEFEPTHIKYPPINLSIPVDRLDTFQYHSPPNSLHLDSSLPGEQYFRFPEVKIRNSTLMRLEFWYLVAPGTSDKASVNIRYYRDLPRSWKIVGDENVEHLSVVDRWTKVVKYLRTDEKSTLISIDFRIFGGNERGEVWVDDIVLEPANGSAVNP